MEDVFALVEAMKMEINKSGKITPLNPIYKHYKKALFLKKVKLYEDEKVFRARIILLKTSEDKPLEVEPEANPEDAKVKVVEKDSDEINEVVDETAKEEPQRVQIIQEKTIVEENKEVQKRLPTLLFCSKTILSAISEYKGLIVKECLLDELHIVTPKKLVDLTTVTGPLGKTKINLNYYLSLYFSLYLRDLNSNFYKTGRYLMELAYNKGFDGIAYLSHVDRQVNYVFFSPKGIAMGATKQMALEQPEQLSEDQPK